MPGNISFGWCVFPVEITAPAIFLYHWILSPITLNIGFVSVSQISSFGFTNDGCAGTEFTIYVVDFFVLSHPLPSVWVA